MLTRTPALPLADQLAARFAERIRTRLMAPGVRLPSVRECARQQDVSPSTVVAAYDKLLAQGLVEARPQRGFFVREAPARTGAAAAHPPAAAGPGPLPSGSQIHATALIRGMFQQGGRPSQPGSGMLPRDWMETAFLPAAVRRLAGSRALESSWLTYGEPQGDAGLRAALAQRLARIDVPAGPQQIVTTVGATQALDIVSRTLLQPGDPVMVEEPGWSVEFARLDALGMRVLPVPRLAAGPDLEVMQRYCEAHAPKLFVSVSVLHNPTGYCLSPGGAHRVLQLAQRFGFHIVEDDTYSHLAPEHATRLTALDGLSCTIYVSGFAKLLAPNWRVGYLAAPPALVEPLLDTKLLSTLTTPSLLEKALAIGIEQGQLRRHAERVRARLEQARVRSVRLAEGAGCRFVAEPAGLFGWVDTGVDTDLLAQRMLDDGWLLAPGALFNASRRPGTLMRINFAATQDAAFWKAFVRARDEMQKGRREGPSPDRCGPSFACMGDRISTDSTVPRPGRSPPPLTSRGAPAARAASISGQSFDSTGCLRRRAAQP
ncbi:aminotransferase-like domain-containing protein [Xylophilus sp.]|uniref:aminotransferase-like domain-containing protein n=1 Tax=Xylophilus sp. TaxID=2653893 RepID=UPI0013B96B6E|nr:PLP-dependent aminotransferase family protein [Xylophilus sp.]KAF1044625.1 MAG: 2-aminoadipate transaminase [Xylophilus sp.]